MLRGKQNLPPSKQHIAASSTLFFWKKIGKTEMSSPISITPPFLVFVVFYSSAGYRKLLGIQVILVHRKQIEFGGT